MSESSMDYGALQACDARAERAATSDTACGEPACAEGEAREGAVVTLAERVRAYEIGLIREALARTRGNQSEAARLLGVPRRTLAHKVLTYGLAQSRRKARARLSD